MFSASELIQSANGTSLHCHANSTNNRYFGAYQQYLVIIPLIQGAPTPEPITEDKIILFLSYKQKMGAKFNTILTLQRNLFAYCRDHNLGEFSSSLKIKNYIKGLHREMLGSHCPFAVSGFTKEMLLSISQKIDHSSFYDLRDFCAFTLCFEGMFRANEMLSLKVQDIEIEESKIKVFIRKTKTDRFGVGRFLYIFSNNSFTSAYKALVEYIEYRNKNKIEGEFLFVSRNRIKLSDRNFRDRIKAWVKIIGHDENAYSTHSFRVGAVETATIAKVPIAAIKQQGGWKSNCFLRYARITEEEASSLINEAFK